MAVESSQNSPVVSFASDIDGNLHMFSRGTSVSAWRGYVIDADNAEHECDAVDQFIGHWHLAPGELCWDVYDVSQAEFIEIRRPGAPPSRTVHPRWSAWNRRDTSIEELDGALDDWSGLKIRVIDMSFHHKPMA